MNNLFGTDGIRSQIGKYPLTHEGLHTLGITLGAWACSQEKKRIIIGTDTRNSATFCKYTLMSGLTQSPVIVTDVGIFPTPALHYLVQKYDYDYGIIITASHNDASYNGIKIVTKQGKLSSEEQRTIEDFKQFPTSEYNYETLGQATYLPDALNLYQEGLDRHFQSNFLKHIKVVIDCAHGAWSFHAEKILKHFGADVISICSSGPNTSINKECGSLFPEKLRDAVLTHKANLGLAFDGDGDRVIAVNTAGEIKDGDDILSILSHHPRYKKNSNIVGTHMTNQGLADYLEEHGKKLVRTFVGDCHILHELKTHDLSLGGEPSGHIIARDFSESSDALFIGLRLLETIILTNNMELTTFKKYPQKIINVPITTRKDLESEIFKNFIEEQSKIVKKSRIMIRYSGTEPVVRILVEYDNIEDSELVHTHLLPSLTHYFI